MIFCDIWLWRDLCLDTASIAYLKIALIFSMGAKTEVVYAGAVPTTIFINIVYINLLNSIILKALCVSTHYRELNRLRQVVWS